VEEKKESSEWIAWWRVEEIKESSERIADQRA